VENQKSVRAKIDSSNERSRLPVKQIYSTSWRYTLNTRLSSVFPGNSIHTHTHTHTHTHRAERRRERDERGRERERTFLPFLVSFLNRYMEFYKMSFYCILRKIKSNCNNKW
jgi:hypothetical protein